MHLAAQSVTVWSPLPFVIGGLGISFVLGFTFGAVRGRSTPMRLLWEGLTSALRGVAVVAVVIVLVTGASVAFGARTGRWMTSPILSGSMSPKLEKGDLALVVPLDRSDAEVGDVVVFNAPYTVGIVRKGEPVIHRIIEVVDPSEIHGAEPGEVFIRTQGDANQKPDPWIVEVTPTGVWRQTHTFRGAGSVWTSVSDRSTRIKLLAGAAILFAGASISEFIRKDEDDLVPEDPSGDATDTDRDLDGDDLFVVEDPEDGL